MTPGLAFACDPRDHLQPLIGKTMKIISGGQTGVDRAALDAALELSISCGGWCPKNRWAEDGPIDVKYPLKETDSPDPALRTRCNVHDADATLILTTQTVDTLSGGTKLTYDVAVELDRSVSVVDPNDPRSVDRVNLWLRSERVAVLNVAGPRESQCPGIYEQTLDLLRLVFHDEVIHRV